MPSSAKGRETARRKKTDAFAPPTPSLFATPGPAPSPFRFFSDPPPDHPPLSEQYRTPAGADVPPFFPSPSPVLPKKQAAHSSSHSKQSKSTEPESREDDFPPSDPQPLQGHF